MWTKGNTSLLLVGVQTCTATLEISMEVSQKIWNHTTLRPSNTTLGHIPKGCTLMPQGHLFSHVFITALFAIARTWKQLGCLLTKEQIKKTWCIYSMEYYSIVKKNGIFKFACKWMELEKPILSEVTQTQKDKQAI